MVHDKLKITGSRENRIILFLCKLNSPNIMTLYHKNILLRTNNTINGQKDLIEFVINFCCQGMCFFMYFQMYMMNFLLFLLFLVYYFILYSFFYTHLLNAYCTIAYKFDFNLIYCCIDILKKKTFSSYGHFKKAGGIMEYVFSVFWAISPQWFFLLVGESIALRSVI